MKIDSTSSSNRNRKNHHNHMDGLVKLINIFCAENHKKEQYLPYSHYVCFTFHVNIHLLLARHHFFVGKRNGMLPVTRLDDDP